MPIVFTDADLTHLLNKTQAGLIYVWSPGMPLSLKGAQIVEGVSKKESIPVTFLKEETAIPSQARCAPQCDPVLKSNILFSMGALRHFPTLFMYRHHQLMKQVVPGYQTEGELRNTLKTNGFIP